MMWAIIRRYRKYTRKCLFGFMVFVIIIQLKSPSVYYLSKRFLKLRAQFVGLENYIPVFDFLTSINSTIVVLDPNMLTYSDVRTEFVTFGIFDEDTYQLKKAVANRMVPYFWTFREHHQVDYKILNLTRVRHNISAHYSFTNSFGTLHLAVIYSRNDYYWISEFTDHDFVNYGNNLSLPLPMAVERFTCRFFSASEHHRLCIPTERSHYLWQLRYAKFLECHFEDVVWQFERDYPLEKIDTTPHKEALAEMMRIGSKFEVPIMLAYGSLLGWYRQCDYIVHSKDMDTTMFVSDFSQELFRELWFSTVLRIYVRLGTLEEGLEFRSFGANTVWFDLFLMYPADKNYYTYMIHTILLELHRSTYPMLTEICTADLLGVLVHIPCDPMKYITAEYGPSNWYAPKQEFYKNVETIYRYNNSQEMNSYIHTYKESCDDPSVLYGCDTDGVTGLPSL